MISDFRKETVCMYVGGPSIEQNEKNLFLSNITSHFSYLKDNEEENYIVCGTELKNNNIWKELVF